MKTEWADCDAPEIRRGKTTDGEHDDVLVRDWTVRDVCGYRFTVPAGSTTDGASIPRFMWRVCGSPWDVPREYAALLHDWLYDAKDGDPDKDGAWPCDVSRKDADEIYYSLLRHFGIPAWKAKLEYWAIRLFGRSHYKGELDA